MNLNGGRAVSAAAVVVIGLSCTACGSGGTSSNRSPAATGTTAASPQTSPQAGAADIPDYQPSTVVSRVAGSTVLHSPDSVEKVSAFYLDFIDESGWQTLSKNTTPYSVDVTVQKAGKGASISISPSRGGTTISISNYPMP